MKKAEKMNEGFHHRKDFSERGGGGYFKKGFHKSQG